MNDIFLRLVPLDGPDEVIMPDPDGNWNIYINAKQLSVQEIEAAAHAKG